MYTGLFILGHQRTLKPTSRKTGRAGSGGKQGVAFVVYQGILLTHVEKVMKQYVKTDECRRKALLKNFDNSSEVSYPQPMHLCCDNCEKKCACQSADCGQFTRFPCSVHEDSSDVSVSTRLVTLDQKNMLHKCLRNYHKSLVMDLLKKSIDQVKTLTDPQFLLGFSEGQIGQV